MITLEKIQTGQIRAEMQIINSDVFFNRVTKGKDSLTLEELITEIYESELLGTERYFIVHDDKRIGLLEFLVEHPIDSQTWLGLLMIEKPYQRQGYGIQGFELFKDMLRHRGITSVRIGVTSGNSPAIEFWKKLGFNRVKVKVKSNGDELIISELQI